MLTVKLDTGFNIEVSFQLSSFFRRLVAWFIDSAVMGIYFLILFTWFGGYFSSHQVLVPLILLPAAFYYPVTEMLTNGQTLGKKLLGIRVITLDGGQATISQYLLRWLLRIVDMPYWLPAMIVSHTLPWYCSVLCFVGVACLFFSGKSQRLGDLVAGTIVIRTRDRSSWQDTVFTELAADYKPRYPEVMRISDKDMNSLKSIIEMSKHRKNSQMAGRIAERITGKLGITTTELPLDFLETLLKDYNYYTSR